MFRTVFTCCLTSMSFYESICNSYLKYLVISKLKAGFITKFIQFEQYRKFQLGGFLYEWILIRDLSRTMLICVCQPITTSSYCMLLE